MQNVCGVQPAIREEDLLAQSFTLFRWQRWTVANKVFHVLAIDPFNDQERLSSSRFITEIELRGNERVIVGYTWQILRIQNPPFTLEGLSCRIA